MEIFLQNYSQLCHIKNSQKPIFLKKPDPVSIQRHSVGLDGVADLDCRRAELPFQSDKTLEKVQTSQRGFAALEGDLEGAMRTCRLYARLQEPVRGFQCP